ncbi:MAG: chorismate lyase [Candidatus Thioglobus sp.]|nr:chorismate lyase [Candidatus Thioglobus pontius]MBL6977207.1 chorismate lyase [Candidatus Thioglobus sp.]MBL6985106.1 chorismate lyase [Candidatus Thioglobus sp.]
MINTNNIVWQDLSLINTAPKNIQQWLDDKTSLTAKLKQQFEDFSVHVLSQQQAQPHSHEIESISISDQYTIREVELLGNGVAVVFARSVIPLTNDTKEILSIGSKPLGEILFNDASIQRGQMQITQTDNLWGRRSTFTIGNTKLLVSEFFTKDLYA